MGELFLGSFHTSCEYILDKFYESRGFLWQNVGWVRFELTTSLVRFSRPDTTSSGSWVPCSGKLSPASRYTMPPLQDKYEVDEYLEYLDNFLQEIASKSTQLQKQSGHSVPWWNQEIQNKVKEERRVRRKVQKRQASQEELEQATKLKKKAVRDRKQNTFRHQIHELASSSKFWKLAKWGKSKANKTPDLPLVPDLETQEGIAKTFEEKTKAFSQQFFPKALVPEPGSESSQTISEIQLSQEVTCEEVEQILAKKKPFTAGGRDKLPNGFLRALGPRFCQALAILTSTCWKLEYFPERFKSAKTVCLRKPGKRTYNQAKAWRPIALLNTTGKLMEAIAAARLSKIAEEAGLLPDIQMGFRKGRSTEVALFLLTSQVEKVWKEGMVASLLSLDISGASKNSSQYHYVQGPSLLIITGLCQKFWKPSEYLLGTTKTLR